MCSINIHINMNWLEPFIIWDGESSTIGRPLLHSAHRYNNASEIHPQIYEFHLNTTAAYPQLLRLVSPKKLSSLQICR